MRTMLADRPTLFLGHDDFITWELAGVPLGKVVHGGVPSLPTRPQKLWEYGEPVDFDSVEPHILNEFEWFVAPRDPAASAPPPQLRLVRQTESYSVWRRVGTVPLDRSVLAEGNLSGRLLDCETRGGRAVLEQGEVAGVRPQPVVAFGDTTYAVSPGSSIRAELPLRPGTWAVSLAFTSTFPLEVAAPGLRATLPANLDRPGPRWPVGRLVVRDRGPTLIDFQIGETLLTPQREASALLGEIVATPVAPERSVPVRRACGRYVDWYIRAPS